MGLIQFLVKREERLKASVGALERVETGGLGEGGDSKKDSGDDIDAKVAGL